MADTAKGNEAHNEPLFIFVNRRQFNEEDGVKAVMKGKEIAALVKVPIEKAVIKRVHGSEQIEIGTEEEVEIEKAQHFFVTRDKVDGGNGA